MDNLQMQIQNYRNYCEQQKRLDCKTLKAYRIDLRQFAEQSINTDVDYITPSILEHYIASLHQKYKPKTVKRKLC